MAKGASDESHPLRQHDAPENGEEERLPATHRIPTYAWTFRSPHLRFPGFLLNGTPYSPPPSLLPDPEGPTMDQQLVGIRASRVSGPRAASAARQPYTPHPLSTEGTLDISGSLPYIWMIGEKIICYVSRTVQQP